MATVAGGTKGTMMWRRMATAVLVAVTGLVGAPHAALADDAGGGNNVVMVVNHEDGALRSRARAAVAQDPGPTVANQNIAVAQATCTGCRTAAAAVQVIIQDGTATDVQPANAAIALNENCNFCQTFAYANHVTAP